MDETIVKTFENNLRQLEAEITRQMRKQDRTAIHIERTAEETEQLAMASEREVAVRTLDHNAYMLREIHGALTRIEEGSYGVCLECEMQISERRMSAVPWARHCLACQDRLDHAVPGAMHALRRAA
jgi:DnaK suppressor protein